MKKLVMALAILGSSMAASAQTKALSYSNFWDNWSIGLKGGVYTPFTHHAFFRDMRASGGLEIGKQFSPMFGLSIEGLGYINPAHSNNSTAIDGTNVSLLGNFNLSNIFAGYNGTPRTFEVEAFAGAGWGHFFNTGMNGADVNFMTSKVGLNFLFNLGESKAWSIKVSPALTYAIDVPAEQQLNSFNANNANAELTAGVVYHFKGSNGANHFTNVRPYDQTEVDGLNASINDLRGQVNSKNNEINAAQRRITQLQNELNECRNKRPIIQTLSDTTKTLESVVTFRQGKTTIDASQQPNVERIASYLNKYRDSKVIIKGYASPEGSLELNKKLAQQRADAVKNTLVKRYRIAASRIDAAGQGIGNMFSEPDWNRVSIATIDQGK